MLNAMRTSELQDCYIVPDCQFNVALLVSSSFNELNCFVEAQNNSNKRNVQVSHKTGNALKIEGSGRKK